MWSWYLIMGDTQGSHDDSQKTKLKGVWLFHQLGLCLETVYLFVDVLISPRNYQKTMRKSWLSSSNTDQTLLTFDMPFTSTVDIRGTKTVQLNTTRQEKNLFTLMLACTADGGKLPPYIIFKRKTLPKVTWPTGIIIHCQDKGWMDDSLTKDWIKTVWAKWPGSMTHKSLVVLDSFRCHKSEAVKEILCDNHRTRLAIIPGGMTVILQPLDVSVNKPMKLMLQEHWNNWYGGDQHTFTATGRMWKPELQDICQWIVDAWSELDPQIIVHAFKKCCISNSDDDHNIDFSEENTMYRQIPQPYTDDKYQRMWMSDDETDQEFDGLSR